MLLQGHYHKVGKRPLRTWSVLHLLVLFHCRNFTTNHFAVQSDVSGTPGYRHPRHRKLVRLLVRLLHSH